MDVSCIAMHLDAVRHCCAGAQWATGLLGEVDMLAAASAWRILEAEHAELRQWLSVIARALEGDAWQRRGPQLNLLRQLLLQFQDFETRTHRPKGVVLMGSMRGRSAQADELLDVLDHDSTHCDELLSRAIDLLGILEQGAAAGGSEVVALLQEHRKLMLQQLDREDTVLRSYTAQLLTSEEWSAVASSISSVVHDGRGRRGPAKDRERG